MNYEFKSDNKYLILYFSISAILFLIVFFIIMESVKHHNVHTLLSIPLALMLLIQFINNYGYSKITFQHNSLKIHKIFTHSTDQPFESIISINVTKHTIQVNFEDAITKRQCLKEYELWGYIKKDIEKLKLIIENRMSEGKL